MGILRALLSSSQFAGDFEGLVGRAGSFGDLQAGDDMRRCEVVGEHQLVLAADVRADVAEDKARGVAGEDRVGRTEFIEPFQERLLVRQALENRFGDEIALPGQLRQIGGGGDPGQRLLGPRLADQFALDEELQRVGDVGLGPGK